jgi:BioD-like phosphotransacetylase family protein
MTYLFIGSTGDHAGHTLLTWALMKRLREKGFNVGFFKPFGTHPILDVGDWVDLDAVLFKSVLGLQEPSEKICPYPLPNKASQQQRLENITGKIKALAVELADGKDILVVMGSRHIFFDDASFGISDIFLNTELEADFILIERFRSVPKSMYSILSIHSLLPGRIKGVILNRVAKEVGENIRNQLVLPLSQKGVSITALLPEDPVLSLRSVGEISQTLEGEFLCGEENRDQAVTGTSLSISGLKQEFRVFKRVFNKIILLKPDGPTDKPNEHRSTAAVAGILLTGGRRPPLQIIEIAEKAKIPLVLVKDDTFMAMQRLEEDVPPLSLADEKKVHYFTEMMDQEGAFEKLMHSLSIEDILHS